MPTTLPDDITATSEATARHTMSLLSQLGFNLSPQGENLVMAGVIFAAFLLLALLAYVAMGALGRRRTDAAQDGWTARMMHAFRGPAVLLVLLTGLMSALISLEMLATFRTLILRVYSASTLVLLIVIGMRVLSLLIDWWFHRLEGRIGSTTVHYASLTRKVVAAVIWAIGGMLVLGQIGIEITPLLTTLGLGSLAVALALQDTLANFFAGIYLMLDRPIRVGDYVRLDTGDEGFVDAIGWRSTRIRLWSNYIVVLPNSRLTSSVITNLVLNQSEVGVYIYGGVGYLNDLDHVERVLIEVGCEVMGRVEGAVATAEPLVRFQEFGDSNITFLAILKATDFAYQYVMKHEFIKAVHRRFKAEGIEIAWPVRQLVAPEPLPVRIMGDPDGTPAVPATGRVDTPA